jgi:hypothetical protein
MRTKALLLIAAAAAAGIVSSNAQVYSVNAVGYVNKTVPAKGFALVSNPLNATDNKVSTLFGGHDGLAVYIWDTASKAFKFTQFSTDFGWDPAGPAATTITPGQGVFLYNSTTSPVTITFVGEVPQGKDPTPLTTPLVAGLQIVSSQVPQAGTADALGYKAADGDAIYQWDTSKQSYNFSQFSTDFGWDPALKSLDVGDAFFLSRTAAGSWTRSFSVND